MGSLFVMCRKIMPKKCIFGAWGHLRRPSVITCYCHPHPSLLHASSARFKFIFLRFHLVTHTLSLSLSLLLTCRCLLNCIGYILGGRERPRLSVLTSSSSSGAFIRSPCGHLYICIYLYISWRSHRYYVRSHAPQEVFKVG